MPNGIPIVTVSRAFADAKQLIVICVWSFKKSF